MKTLMARKDMRRSDWHRITRRRYLARPVSLAGREGVAGLLLVEAVTAPLRVKGAFGDLTIADAGYSWLEIALNGVDVFTTAQFDESGRLIQIYFDVTSAAGVCFDDPDNPTFEDAFLDVIYDPAGGVKTLDREELEAARAREDISREEYEHALRTGEKLEALVRERGREIAETCGKVRMDMMKQEARQEVHTVMPPEANR